MSQNNCKFIVADAFGEMSLQRIDVDAYTDLCVVATMMDHDSKNMDEQQVNHIRQAWKDFLSVLDCVYAEMQERENKGSQTMWREHD